MMGGNSVAGMGPVAGMSMQQQMQGELQMNSHAGGASANAGKSIMDNMMDAEDVTELQMRMDGSLTTADGQSASDTSRSVALMSGHVTGSDVQSFANPVAAELDIEDDLSLLDMLDIPDTAAPAAAYDLDDLAMLDMLDIPDI